jgi:hypothetical protein
MKYPKIQSIFKRDPKTHKFIMGDYSCPEFGYLDRNIWVFTEKIHGTNIRVLWDTDKSVEFRGRTDKAQIPPFLYDYLAETFTPEKMIQGGLAASSGCLYGEGYGNRIQKMGKQYNPDGVGFILFDIKIGNYWFMRHALEQYASQLNIKCVPIIERGPIQYAIDLIMDGVKSTFGDFLAEGLVLKPDIPLFDRNGKRIITKIKHGDLPKSGFTYPM